MATSPLDRLAPFSTTGVGSLPMTDPSDAVAHLLASYDVPFCPQLPRLDGDMIAEWLGGPGADCGWSPERDRERPYAWNALLKALAVSPPEHRIVKLQVTGPLTLCWALGPAEPPLEFARDVATWLAANAAAQVAALAEHGLVVVLVVDEPALAAVPGSPELPTVWDPLRSVAAAWGLHLCCSPPWQTVERAEPDLLSIDIVNTPLGPSGAAACARLQRAGTHVAWGIVPTSAAGGAQAALARLGRMRSLLADAGADPTLVGERSLLSASCGTGADGEHAERQVAAALARVARDPGLTLAHAT